MLVWPGETAQFAATFSHPYTLIRRNSPLLFHGHISEHEGVGPMVDVKVIEPGATPSRGAGRVRVYPNPACRQG